MKILITTDWYSPAVNGVVTSVLNLRRELELRGHEVRVLTLSQDLHSSVQDGVTRIGSVAAGLVYPGVRLRTALAGRWVRELVEWGRTQDVFRSPQHPYTQALLRAVPRLEGLGPGQAGAMEEKEIPICSSIMICARCCFTSSSI